MEIMCGKGKEYIQNVDPSFYSKPPMACPHFWDFTPYKLTPSQ